MCNKSVQQMKEQFLADMGAVGAANIAAECVDILTAWGFFNMPASTRYHGTAEGDLFEHSRGVATILQNITEAHHVTWQNPRSPILIGYFHDLCKCDAYKRPQIGETLKGEPIISDTLWEYRKDQLLSGHGDKSVMLASTLCKLTEEEMLCIRYHMGAYKTEDWDGYDRAIKKYETVLWTHHADMLASKVVGV